jgi:4-hydroxybenzoate polyprenyltransferase
LLLAYAYSINDYYDKKLRKKYFIFPLFFFFFTLPLLNNFAVLTSLVFLLLFTFYSWPKVWLEGRPIISTLSNSLGFTLLFLLPFKNIEEIAIYSLLILLFFLLNTAAQLLHEIIDFNEDKKINKITTAVKFGVKNSLNLFKLCLMLIVLVSISLFPNFYLISISSSIFSFYFLPLEKVKKETRREFKVLGIIIGIIYLLELLR